MARHQRRVRPPHPRMRVCKNISCFKLEGNCQQLPFFFAFKKRVALVSLAMAMLIE